MQELVNLVKRLKNKLPITFSGTNLTNNEIKYIMKMIKSLENREILLKETIRKIDSQEGGFINFNKTINDSWFTINEKCRYTLS